MLEIRGITILTVSFVAGPKIPDVPLLFSLSMMLILFLHAFNDSVFTIRFSTSKAGPAFFLCPSVLMHSFLLSLRRTQHHVCTVCERPFQGHLFFERGGRAYCERHFDMVRGLTRCWLLSPLPPNFLPFESAPAYYFFQDSYNSYLTAGDSQKMTQTRMMLLWCDLIISEPEYDWQASVLTNMCLALGLFAAFCVC